MVRWENHLKDLTPVERIKDLYFKREDKFAPLGFGSINGSKLRQCIWVVNNWVKKRNVAGVISGSVIGSPQHPFIAAVCKHYGLGCLIVTGSKNPLSHKNMQLAAQMGAKFYMSPITYAKSLQSIAFRLKDKIPNHEVLETNITLDEKYNPADAIEGFHKIGSYQVNNLPENTTNIIIPCGSCNSVTSILYGLALNPPKKLKNIILMGIGNNGSKNLKYIPQRLGIISKVIGKNLNDSFSFPFLPNDGFNIIHYNPNGEGFCTYDDWMPYDYHGLALHPRYEGKCFNYIDQNRGKFDKYLRDDTLFWVVGNEPTYIP